MYNLNSHPIYNRVLGHTSLHLSDFSWDGTEKNYDSTAQEIIYDAKYCKGNYMVIALGSSMIVWDYTANPEKQIQSFDNFFGTSTSIACSNSYLVGVTSTGKLGIASYV